MIQLLCIDNKGSINIVSSYDEIRDKCSWLASIEELNCEESEVRGRLLEGEVICHEGIKYIQVNGPDYRKANDLHQLDRIEEAGYIPGMEGDY